MERGFGVISLRADDHFIGGLWELESNSLGVIRFDGLGEIQRRELDFPVPRPGGEVVGVRVENTVSDRIVGYLLAVAVAKHENRREYFFCRNGASRITDDRTPRSAKAIAAFSESIRGPAGNVSSSVASRPSTNATMRVPDVPTKGRFEPARASPIASTPRRSVSAEPRKSLKSWLKAKWITPSEAAAAACRPSRSSRSPRCTSARAGSYSGSCSSPCSSGGSTPRAWACSRRPSASPA